MPDEISKPDRKRRFLPDNLVIHSWDSIRIYFSDLLDRPVKSPADLERWLFDRSELNAVLEEELAWRYIKMNCDTANKQLSESFNQFVTEIEPEISRFSDLLDRKLVGSPFLSKLDKRKYLILIRAVRNRIKIFREENIPLFAELQVEEQKYGKISSEMTIRYNGKELTLQMAGNYLKEINRDVRKQVFILIHERRMKDIAELQDLFSTLIERRDQVAKNAGFRNYRDFKFAELGRFDYTVNDCEDFHESIAEEVCPIAEEILKKRRESLGFDELRPWDLDVDPELKPPLRPFTTSRELMNGSIRCLQNIRPAYGDYLKTMDQKGYLDLDSRKGKAPGGFNYPLYESNVPFIFMNATGNLRDLETMVHESGHAIHSFLSGHLELVDYKNLPAEVAELASMSMELITMDQWNVFFNNPDELRRAKRNQLEGIILLLPWIASVDKFQHWIYLNPAHSIEQRNNEWLAVLDGFDTGLVNWSGYEKYREHSWQKQLHIYESPFYYIEYGIAQLGAVSMWKNYRENPEKTLDAYEKALGLGYSVKIPEIYETAGIRFDFSREYVRQLMQFVAGELALPERKDFV
ncbi:MAG: M3 family oligoendopeptidase [Bacteroidales bacterium]|nr:MAG: M3 family oligoendopeptidase [Bacteroidales bacterium]